MAKRKIRRNPGKKRNMYFNKDTQASIESYQQSEDHDEKEKIYRTDIMPAFEQLSESLIFVYGFNSPYESVTSMKGDCVAFLYETIHKWDPARGTKAFSYFNVVAKNWLIIRCRNAKKNDQRHVSMSDFSVLNSRDKAKISESKVAPSPQDILEKAELRDRIMDVINEIDGRVKKPNEVLCAKAIRTVFENIDNLDFLNKRAIYVYVREISGLTSKQLSVSMSKIRKHYKEIVHDDRIVDLL
jgi:hypothetical protein|tara:strand:- start:1315 stop:2040 length:726 start_codon:yes stop_codon:yes gene_type:complete